MQNYSAHEEVLDLNVCIEHTKKDEKLELVSNIHCSHDKIF